jgi:hypothetical protein
MQHKRLSQETRRLGISMAAVIRRLIDQHFAREKVADAEDALDRLTGMAEGSGEPVAREHNRYLYGKAR